jgi:hypothetical protein
MNRHLERYTSAGVLASATRILTLAISGDRFAPSTAHLGRDVNARGNSVSKKLYDFLPHIFAAFAITGKDHRPEIYTRTRRAYINILDDFQVAPAILISSDVCLFH